MRVILILMVLFGILGDFTESLSHDCSHDMSKEICHGAHGHVATFEEPISTKIIDSSFSNNITYPEYVPPVNSGYVQKIKRPPIFS